MCDAYCRHHPVIPIETLLRHSSISETLSRYRVIDHSRVPDSIVSSGGCIVFRHAVPFTPIFMPHATDSEFLLQQTNSILRPGFKCI